MRSNQSIFIPVLLLLFLTACGSKPSWVLSEDKMSDVLFDMHLAEAEVNDNYQVFHDDDEKKQELLNAVFKKHKITVQEFDTSLVWYNAHLDRYIKIYDRLNEKYTTLSDTLKIQEQLDLQMASEKNSVNIWKGERTFTLLPSQYFKNNFTFKLDSSVFQAGDTYEMKLSVLGIHDSIQPVITFCAVLPDTTIVSRLNISQNGPFSIVLAPLGDQIPESLSGSVHIPVSSNNPNITFCGFEIWQRKRPASDKSVQ